MQNDILKEYIAQNEYIFPPRPSMRLVVDTVEYASRYLPLWNPISISGYHIREAGATAVQELAFTLNDGFEYVRWCLDRGMQIDEFAPRLSFFFNISSNFFEEVTKLRVARRIWCREMQQTFGARNPRSWWLRTHAQTSGATLTARQPETNITRVALQALAAVLGMVPVSPHQLRRRGMGPSFGEGGPPGAKNAAGDRSRNRRDRHRGPLGG